MKNSVKRIFLMAVLALVLCINAPAAWAQGSAAESVAQNFAEAYYMLDPSMADFMSQDALVNENDVDMVELYFRLREGEAERRGIKLSYLQMKPILVETDVLEMDDDTATIRMQTTALRSINSFYRISGWIFGLLDEHKFDTVITLVKEDGQWKVGPGALSPMI